MQYLETMDKKKHDKKSDRETLEAVKGLLRPRPRIGKDSSQEVVFKVDDNSELRYVISCLLRVSIVALELEGTPSSPRMPYLSNESAIMTVLELINDILPDDQLESYDAIEKLLLSDKSKET